MASNGPKEPRFYHAYYFIPAPPRNTADPHFGDGRPCSHDRYHEGRISGKIRVKMTTATPLLLPDAARKEPRVTEGHFLYPVRVDKDGKPLIPPTSVKGMLRAAYEAVTNSRFSVFQGHNERLGFRRTADESKPTIMRPAMISNGKIRLMEAARVDQYGKNFIPLPGNHGEKVKFRAYYDTSDFQYRVTSVINVEDEYRKPAASGEKEFEGWLCITNQNTGKKKYERIFFDDPNANRYKVPPLADFKSSWDELLNNYRKTNKRYIKERTEKGTQTEYFGHQPGQPALSRHLYDVGSYEIDTKSDLNNPVLCYARVENNTVTGLYPVIISRDLYKLPPEEFLDDSLKPAKNLDQLSPADRVFGWVGQEGQGAHRGQLRIGPIQCQVEDAIETFETENAGRSDGYKNKDGLPLAILGAPKPEQVRFYLQSGDSGFAREPKANAYANSARQTLRGRKTYPHHSNLFEGYWRDINQHASPNRPDGKNQWFLRARSKEGGQACPVHGSDAERDNQNRSIAGWVRPGTEFLFDIFITNLSRFELGALLWLLDINWFQQQSNVVGTNYYHRLGGGKPLGFGSVVLEIDPDEVNLYDHGGLEKRYQTLQKPDKNSMVNLDACVRSCYMETLIDIYPPRTKKICFEKIKFIEAFLASAKGLPNMEGQDPEDAWPVCYPLTMTRAEKSDQFMRIPATKAEIYRWFVANEKNEYPAALRNITAEDPSLEVYEIDETTDS